MQGYYGELTAGEYQLYYLKDLFSRSRYDLVILRNRFIRLILSTLNCSPKQWNQDSIQSWAVSMPSQTPDNVEPFFRGWVQCWILGRGAPSSHLISLQAGFARRPGLKIFCKLDLEQFQPFWLQTAGLCLDNFFFFWKSGLQFPFFGAFLSYSNP